jgi:hypothetical protein
MWGPHVEPRGGSRVAFPQGAARCGLGGRHRAPALCPGLVWPGRRRKYLTKQAPRTIILCIADYRSRHGAWASLPSRDGLIDSHCGFGPHPSFSSDKGRYRYRPAELSDRRRVGLTTRGTPRTV